MCDHTTHYPLLQKSDERLVLKIHYICCIISVARDPAHIHVSQDEYRNKRVRSKGLCSPDLHCLEVQLHIAHLHPPKQLLQNEVREFRRLPCLARLSFPSTALSTEDTHFSFRQAKKAYHNKYFDETPSDKPSHSIRQWSAP